MEGWKLTEEMGRDFPEAVTFKLRPKAQVSWLASGGAE